MLVDHLLHIAAYRAPHPPQSVQELRDGIRHEREPWIEVRQDAVLIMELQPPEAAVTYVTDDCCHVDGLPQDYVIQDRVDASTPCPARDQPLFGYASEDLP